MQQASGDISGMIIGSRVKCHIMTFLGEGASCRVTHGTACALQGGKEAQNLGSMPVAERRSRRGQAEHCGPGDEGLMAAASGWD